MALSTWPCEAELIEIRKMVSEMSGKSSEDVQVVVSPYRICPLGAHIDHQGGTVSAMTINKGILLGFVPSTEKQVVLRSGQFTGEVKFSVDEIQHPKHVTQKNRETCASGCFKPKKENCWDIYARGALYALQQKGNSLAKGIIGYVSGSQGLDSSGLSSSAAVGIAYLMALESANQLSVLPTENIEFDRLIENEYLGLKNGILDQSAILLSRSGCLMCMNCNTKEYKLVPQSIPVNLKKELRNSYKILLAFSGVRQALTNNPGYNRRVTECQDAARVLLQASGNYKAEHLFCKVEREAYEMHKGTLEPNLAKRAEHYFTENARVIKGLEAWASGNIEEFGKLISASGLSSIQNYECGSEPLIQLYNILVNTRGVYGARFSGAGFRGCCVAFVDADCAEEAASFVDEEYRKLQPVLATQLNLDSTVLICEASDCARII